MKILAVTSLASTLLLLAPTSSDISELTRLNALLQAQTERYDAAGVGSYTADDFTLVPGNGQVWNRAAFLKDIADRSATWEANDPSDVHIRVYNNDTALVVAILHIKYHLAGKLHDIRARYTDTWVKRNGKWWLVAGQATKMPANNPAGS